MKRLKRNVSASSDIVNNEVMFTPDDIIELLSHIDELKNTNISLTETPDGILEFTIGNSAYQMSGVA